MGFPLPESPRTTNQHDGDAGTTTPSSSNTEHRNGSPNAVTTQDAGTGPDSPEFRIHFASAIERRRHALAPNLAVNAVGSPRSPPFCLSHEHRVALVQRQEAAFFKDAAASGQSTEQGNDRSSQIP